MISSFACSGFFGTTAISDTLLHCLGLRDRTQVHSVEFKCLEDGRFPRWRLSLDFAQNWLSPEGCRHDGEMARFVSKCAVMDPGFVCTVGLTDYPRDPQGVS